MTKESYWKEWESHFGHDCNFSSLVHGQMANFRQTFRLWEEPKNLRGHFFTCTTLHWSGELYPQYSRFLIFVQKVNFDKSLLFDIFAPKLENILEYFILKNIVYLKKIWIFAPKTFTTEMFNHLIFCAKNSSEVSYFSERFECSCQKFMEKLYSK